MPELWEKTLLFLRCHKYFMPRGNVFLMLRISSKKWDTNSVDEIKVCRLKFSFSKGKKARGVFFFLHQGEHPWCNILFTWPLQKAPHFLYCSNSKIVELTGLVFSWQTAGIIIRNYEVRIHTGVGGLYNQKWKRMGCLMAAAASGRKFMFFMSLFCDIAMNRLEQTLSQHDHQTGRFFFIWCSPTFLTCS